MSAREPAELEALLRAHLDVRDRAARMVVGWRRELAPGA